jgi:DNA-binding transcriptional LysR family regulator
MLDVRRLRMLQELERHGTVNAAAAALHLTPSAVSQQLASLARETGCPLIERDGRNVRLTSAAKVVLGHAEDVFAQLELMDADLAAHRTGEVGVVRVGSFQTAASGLVVPAAVELRRTYPRLEIHVHQMDVPAAFDELLAGRLDVVLSVEYAGSPPASDRRLTRTPILSDEMRVLLPAGHRLAAEPSVALADLADEPWIGNLAGTPCLYVSMAACAAAGFTPLLRHQVDDWAIIVDLAAAGLGVGLIPTLASPPARPDVAIRPVAGARVVRNIVARTRRGAEAAPTVGAVLDALVTEGARRAGAASQLDAHISKTD